MTLDPIVSLHLIGHHFQHLNKQWDSMLCIEIITYYQVLIIVCGPLHRACLRFIIETIVLELNSASKQRARKAVRPAPLIETFGPPVNSIVNPGLIELLLFYFETLPI